MEDVLAGTEHIHVRTTAPKALGNLQTHQSGCAVVVKVCHPEPSEILSQRLSCSPRRVVAPSATALAFEVAVLHHPTSDTITELVLERSQSCRRRHRTAFAGVPAGCASVTRSEPTCLAHSVQVCVICPQLLGWNKAVGPTREVQL